MRPLFALLLSVLLATGLPADEAPTVTAFRLDNGLRVRLRPVKNVNEVALVVLFDVGGDHDPEGRSGLAHLVEHLYVTAAAGEAKARPVEEIVRRYPRGWNAQTGDRYTVIATVFPKNDLDEELKDAAWRMGDLKPDEADLKRELPRMRDELGNMFGGLPLLGAVNQARERVRPTPRGGRKGGRIEHLEATKLDEVRARWRDHYKPTNALLVLAGAVEADTARKLIKDLFSPLPAGKPVAAPGEPGKPRAGKPEALKAAFRVMMPAEACLAWAAPAPDDPRYPAFLVLAARLTRDSSKLKAGPGRFPVAFRLMDDPAVVTVSVPLGKDETDEQALKRLSEFVDAGLAPQRSDADIALVRGFYGTFLGFPGVPDFVHAQNLYGLAFALGRREQMGVDAEKMLKAVEKVNNDRLRRAAGEVFGKERQAAVVLRPREK